MGPYEEILRKLGLFHLKDDPERVQEAILRELGMSELKGDPEAMLRRGEEMLQEKTEEFLNAKDELGKLIQKNTLKRNN